MAKKLKKGFAESLMMRTIGMTGRETLSDLSAKPKRSIPKYNPERLAEAATFIAADRYRPIVEGYTLSVIIDNMKKSPKGYSEAKIIDTIKDAGKGIWEYIKQLLKKLIIVVKETFNFSINKKKKLSKLYEKCTEMEKNFDYIFKTNKVMGTDIDSLKLSGSYKTKSVYEELPINKNTDKKSGKKVDYKTFAREVIKKINDFNESYFDLNEYEDKVKLNKDREKAINAITDLVNSKKFKKNHSATDDEIGTLGITIAMAVTMSKDPKKAILELRNSRKASEIKGGKKVPNNIKENTPVNNYTSILSLAHTVMFTKGYLLALYTIDKNYGHVINNQVSILNKLNTAIKEMSKKSDESGLKSKEIRKLIVDINVIINTERKLISDINNHILDVVEFNIKEVEKYLNSNKINFIKKGK